MGQNQSRSKPYHQNIYKLVLDLQAKNQTQICLGGCTVLNTEKAAKLLIVAWIKEWPMRTLLDAIREKQSNDLTQEETQKFAEEYQFMPKNLWVYISHGGNGMSAKKFMFDNYRKINDKLWDTTDNLKRLEHWVYFANKKCPNAKASKNYAVEDQNEKNKARKDYSAFVKSRKHYKEIFDKSSGHHWFTVK